LIGVYGGDAGETLVFVFFASSPEKLIGASFAAKVTSCKEKGTFFTNVLKTNRAFPQPFHFIRGGTYYTVNRYHE
jgi:hypothetical protein